MLLAMCRQLYMDTFPLPKIEVARVEYFKKYSINNPIIGVGECKHINHDLGTYR